jgi:orotate phosphoribosyltransferase
LIESACSRLAELVSADASLGSIDYVIGPALGAVVMSFCMALRIQAVLVPGHCRASFTEKLESPDGPKMVLRRSSLRPGDRVLVVEDVLTTGGSVDRTIDAVVQAGGDAAPVVAVLVNRSSLDTARGDRKIVSLIDEPMPLWLPEECPLCGQGSEALRPKDTDHWARLNAAY